MKRFVVALLSAGLICGGWSVMAQQPTRVASTGGKSPHETTSAVIARDRVTITYGRPFTKDPRTGAPRKIWGGVVPYGKAWRFGADEATLLTTQKPLIIGATTIPAGAYTLYFIPEESGASKLAFSKALGGWGIPVDEQNDLARVDAAKEDLTAPVDQLTVKVAKKDEGGVIEISWENTKYSVAFTVQK
ncbi:MAG TPA: DUF2911 domain-containing protein [Verrucomicrobiae bacterium]|jgi:hypothetical protein|nr:DUF2911 domain-containing protein [Verrucomicrobiae bacterium]